MFEYRLVEVCETSHTKSVVYDEGHGSIRYCDSATSQTYRTLQEWRSESPDAEKQFLADLENSDDDRLFGGLSYEDADYSYRIERRRDGERCWQYVATVPARHFNW